MNASDYIELGFRVCRVPMNSDLRSAQNNFTPALDSPIGHFENVGITRAGLLVLRVATDWPELFDAAKAFAGNAPQILAPDWTAWLFSVNEDEKVREGRLQSGEMPGAAVDTKVLAPPSRLVPVSEFIAKALRWADEASVVPQMLTPQQSATLKSAGAFL